MGRNFSVCDLGVLAMLCYPEQTTDREGSLRLLRSLRVDRKFAASAAANNPTDPFVDPDGYRAFLDGAEAELREGSVH
jgi:hypothetical protein